MICHVYHGGILLFIEKANLVCVGLIFYANAI